MATVKTTLTSSWQLIVPAGKEFFLENPTEFNALVAFADSTPVTDVGHTLVSGLV